MTKSVNIENCLASSKLQKYFEKKIGKIFKKIFENRRFLIVGKKIFLKITDFQIFFKKSSQFFLKYFSSFELARQFSMSTDFVINFDFKND